MRLEARATMLRDQITQSKLATRQPNGGQTAAIGTAPCLVRLRISNPVLIAATEWPAAYSIVGMVKQRFEGRACRPMKGDTP
jgi:hypothetical protein